MNVHSFINNNGLNSERYVILGPAVLTFALIDLDVDFKLVILTYIYAFVFPVRLLDISLRYINFNKLPSIL